MNRKKSSKKSFSFVRFFLLFVILVLLSILLINVESLLNIDAEYRDLLVKVAKALLVASIGYLVILIVDGTFSSKIVSGAERGLTELQRVLPSISKIVRIIILAVVAIIVTQIFGLDISVLLTGFGIGGIAIAFAARDTIANVFGSLSVVSDKTFKIGDRIKFMEYVGDVLEIGIRSTRIKTDSGTEVIIPNVKLSNGLVENISMGSIGIKEIIIYLSKNNSSEKIKKAISVANNILNKHDNIVNGEAIFNSFDAKGLEIRIRYELDFIESEVQTKQEILLSLKEGLDKEKIEL